MKRLASASAAKKLGVHRSVIAANWRKQKVNMV
jgi:hypothetical protein